MPASSSSSSAHAIPRRQPSERAVLLSRRIEALLQEDEGAADHVDGLIMALAYQIAQRTTVLRSAIPDVDTYRLDVGLSVVSWAEHYEHLIKGESIQAAITFLQNRDTDAKA